MPPRPTAARYVPATSPQARHKTTHRTSKRIEPRIISRQASIAKQAAPDPEEVEVEGDRVVNPWIRDQEQRDQCDAQPARESGRPTRSPYGVDNQVEGAEFAAHNHRILKPESPQATGPHPQNRSHRPEDQFEMVLPEVPMGHRQIGVEVAVGDTPPFPGIRLRSPRCCPNGSRGASSRAPWRGTGSRRRSKPTDGQTKSGVAPVDARDGLRRGPYRAGGDRGRAQPEDPKRMGTISEYP